MKYLGLCVLTLIWFLNPLRMRWPLVPNEAYAEEIEFFDSKTQPGKSYLLVENCLVDLKTAKIKDLCYVNKEIKTQCGVDYKLENSCGKN